MSLFWKLPDADLCQTFERAAFNWGRHPFLSIQRPLDGTDRAERAVSSVPGTQQPWLLTDDGTAVTCQSEVARVAWEDPGGPGGPGREGWPG